MHRLYYGPSVEALKFVERVRLPSSDGLAGHVYLLAVSGNFFYSVLFNLLSFLTSFLPSVLPSFLVHYVTCRRNCRPNLPARWSQTVSLTPSVVLLLRFAPLPQSAPKARRAAAPYVVRALRGFLPFTASTPPTATG